MTRADLEKLLVYPEQPWLDWKRDFPKGLDQPAKTPEHRVARGEMIKDIQALANIEGSSLRYLVWGVKDVQVKRIVFPFAPPHVFDDANFQTWVENALDPSISFSYYNVTWEEGVVIGVFQIYPLRDPPAVAVEDFGDVLRQGQVWFRDGTRNTIALRKQLKAYFFPTGIDFDVGFLKDGQLQSQWSMRSARQKIAGLEAPSRLEVDELLNVFRAQAERERTSPDSALVDDGTISGSSLLSVNRKLVPYEVDRQRIDEVTATLTRVGFRADLADFVFTGLRADQGPFASVLGNVISGPSRAKYAVFCDLERTLKRFAHETAQFYFTNSFEWIDVWGKNIGVTGAENVEVVIECEGKTLELASRVPTFEPFDEPNKDPYGLNFDYTKVFAEDTTIVKKLPRFVDTLEIVVPDRLVHLARFAVMSRPVGVHVLTVTLYGKNIPKALTHRIQIEIQ